MVPIQQSEGIKCKRIKKNVSLSYYQNPASETQIFKRTDMNTDPIQPTPNHYSPRYKHTDQRPLIQNERERT